MKRTLLVYSTNRAVERETALSIAAVRALGCAIVEQSGSSDVSFARNFALTGALIEASKKNCDTVLMVDDDVVFTVEQASTLVAASRKLKAPCSGVYCDAHGHVSATPQPNGRYLTVLGFLAIPTQLLLALAKESPTFIWGGQKIVEFTYAKSEVADSEPRPDARPRIWVGEDHRLTGRLGGAHLLPLVVGHVKKRILAPSDEELSRFKFTTLEPDEIQPEITIQ
jgi:hypothetical protein